MWIIEIVVSLIFQVITWIVKIIALGIIILTLSYNSSTQTPH